MNRKKALEILNETHYWSFMGQVTVWDDFVNVVHNVSANLNDTFIVDFERYGYKEFVLFGQCLSLFEDRGYDDVTALIDEVTVQTATKDFAGYVKGEKE